MSTKVRIAAGASVDEAAAIASALEQHTGDERIEVYVGDATQPTVVHSAGEGETGDTTGKGSGAGVASDCCDRGTTDRERRLREEVADIKRDSPEKYRERLAEQGKLFIRDRLELWFGESDPVPGEGSTVSGESDGDRSGSPVGLHFEDGKFANFDGWHPSSPDAASANDGSARSTARTSTPAGWPARSSSTRSSRRRRCAGS